MLRKSTREAKDRGVESESVRSKGEEEGEKEKALTEV